MHMTMNTSCHPPPHTPHTRAMARGAGGEGRQVPLAQAPTCSVCFLCVFARACTHTHALAHTHTHTFALTHPLTHTKPKHKQVGLASSERGVGAPPSFASRRRSVGAAWRAGEFVLLARARTHARCRPWSHPPSPQTCGQGVAAWGGGAVVSMPESHRPLGACVECFDSPAHPSPPHTRTHTGREKKRRHRRRMAERARIFCFLLF